MTWRRAAAGVALVLVAGLGAWLLWRLGGVDNPGGVRTAVAAAGWWAPFLFVGAQVLVTSGPFPRTLFTAAAGVLFGTAVGLVLTLAATVASSAVAYWLVRAAGSGVVERYAPARTVDWVRSRLAARGMLAMVSLRLIPVLPFFAQNCALTLAGARLAPYLLATALGVLPGTATVVILGDAAIGGEPPPALFAISLAGAAVGVIGMALAARRPQPASA